MSQTPLLAFAAGALGLAGIYAAHKNVSWLSTVEAALDPKHYKQIALPNGVGSPGSADNTFGATGEAEAGDPHAKVVAFAASQLGKPYLYGGSGPNSWDCSGLTRAAFATVGYVMPHNAEAQMVQTRKYAIARTTSPPAGCLVFYGFGGFADHCGISTGGGEMIEAPHTGDVVKYYSIAEEVVSLPLIAVTDPLGAVQSIHGIQEN